MKKALCIIVLTILFFNLKANANDIILAWNQNITSSIIGYKLYFYDDSKKPSDENLINDPEVRKTFWSINIEGANTFQRNISDLNLDYNRPYKFFITALSQNLESKASNIVEVIIDLSIDELYPPNPKEPLPKPDPPTITLK